jgi:cytochrome c553
MAAPDSTRRAIKHSSVGSALFVVECEYSNNYLIEPSRRVDLDDFLTIRRALCRASVPNSKKEIAMRATFKAAGALACWLAVASQAAAADLSRAKEIVEGKCFICHGVDGESSSAVFPRLSGQHAAYVARQLADYKSGKRKSDAMRPMVEDLSAEDMKLLGQYFESKAPLKHAVEDKGLASVGEFIYSRGNPFSGVPSCASCHGAAGNGTEVLPRLAGQHAQYTEKQLKEFVKRERTNDNAVMHTVASKLTELELKAVASFISGL